MKKVHRFLLPSDLAHQLRDVLKMEVGEEIDVMDGAGIEGRAKIVSTDPRVEVELTSIERNSSESKTKVILYAAILKRENFELIVQKATEVGVSEIVPVISARTIKTGLKLDRLQKIAAEAAEQSGRAVVPIINEPMRFKQALIHCARNDVNYFFDPSGNITHHLPAGRQGRPDPIRSAGVLIGPEGGWTDEELHEAKMAGCKTRTLGTQVLRGETATIIASYLAVHNII